MKPKFTMASELIAELQKIVDKDGDLPVAIYSERGFCSSAIVYTDEYYYDGGYLAPDMDQYDSWISSRTRTESGHLKLQEGFPHSFIRLYSRWPGDGDSKVDGRSLRERCPEDWDWLDTQELAERNLFDGELPKYTCSREKDTALNCYPYIASLESIGLQAIGDGNMKTARETLALKYATLKKLQSGERTVQDALTSPERADREAAKFYIDKNLSKESL